MHEPYQCAAMFSALSSVTEFRQTNLTLLELDGTSGSERHLFSTNIIKQWPSQ